jgi:hypothetical protein
MLNQYTIDTTHFDAIFDRIREYAVNRSVPVVVEIAKLRILDRTKRGLSFKGYRFRKYSDGHAQKRRKAKLQSAECR